MGSDAEDSQWYILVQWNDYRKENFAKVIGVITRGKKHALELQMQVSKDYLTTSWMIRSNRIPAISRDGDNLIIDPSTDATPQRMTFSLLGVTPSPDLFRGDEDAKVWVALYVKWNGLGGSNICQLVGLYASLKEAKAKIIAAHGERTDAFTFVENPKSVKYGAHHEGGYILYERKFDEMVPHVKH